MLRNYFRISLRNLKRNKGYATINILGLSMGIAICLLIFLVISFESGFDNFHKKKDRIYRVLTEYHHADSKEIFYGRGVPFGFPDAIRSGFKQVEETATIFYRNNVQLNIPGTDNNSSKKFKEEKGVFYMTPSFFKIFDFPLLSGSYESLSDPDNALISERNSNQILWRLEGCHWQNDPDRNSYTVKVSGVLAEPPANTGFPLKLAISYGTGFTKRFLHSTDFDGTNSSNGCYVLLSPHASHAEFNSQLIAYSKKVKSPDNKDVQVAQPFKEVHFDTQSGDYSGKTISRKLINGLWMIGGFILLIACVNFINLSTAQAVNRAKEVGVRKVLGSNKWQLQMQFLSETFLIVLASIAISLILALIALALYQSPAGIIHHDQSVEWIFDFIIPVDPVFFSNAFGGLLSFHRFVRI